MKSALGKIAVTAALVMSCGCTRVKLPPATIVSGQSQEALSWQRAVELCLARHPELRKARAELQAKLHNRNQALGGYLPSADGSLSRTRTTGDSHDNSLSIGLEVTQPLFAGFEITADAMQAWREWNAAYFAYVEKSAEVRQSLRAAYVGLLRLNKLLEVNERIAVRRQDNADLLKLRYDAGREHEGSLKRAQAIAEQADFEVRQVKRQIESQSLLLGRQLGGYFATAMPLAEDLDQLQPDIPDSPGNYITLAEAAPTVLRLIRTAEAAKAAVVGAQSNLWPTVNGTFDYGYSGNRPGDLEKDDTTLGLAVSVPLFHGGQNVQGTLESNAAYRAAREAAKSARDLRVAELSRQWSAFKDAAEFVSVRHSFLEASRKRSEIVYAQYTSGLADFQDFDIAEQELADSEKADVQSLSDALTEEAGWMFVKGIPLEAEGRQDGK